MSPAIVSVAKGAVVEAEGRRFCVRGFVDVDRIKVIDLDTYRERELALTQVVEASAVEAAKPDFTDIPERQWRAAVRRFQAIRPLLEAKERRSEYVARAAEEAGVSESTIYRWLERFETEGVVTALVRRRRSDRGGRRLSRDVEALMRQVIDEFYLTPQKRKITLVHRELKRLCRHEGLPPPHINTLYKRIQQIQPEKAVRRRQGRNAAFRYRPKRGEFPGADFPYAVLQIDHTKVDIILVDEEHRIPIGRPWITVAIDVFSRTVAGFYVSFDPPGAQATGLCIARAILPKDADLRALELDFDWPCVGIPRVIHADNAKEFRGRMLENACIEYGINLQFRPVKQPQYGGHIERLLGNLSSEIHALPGATFSSPQDRGEYDSEKHAAMTLREFEYWLTNLIAGYYHNEFHSEIGTTPMRRYREGILGDAERPGTGVVQLARDPERLRLDFLPFEERTIQPYGVLWDNIAYYAEVLQRWIRAPDPENRRRNRKFVFRRDPRDLSCIWFYDPEAQQHYRIPYRDTSLPSISLWELRAVRQELRAQGRQHVDEETIFAAFEEMRRTEETSKRLTKSTARKRARRRHHQEAVAKRQPTPEPTEGSPEREDPEKDLPDIKPFDEVERF
jgi:putative transposase